MSEDEEDVDLCDELQAPKPNFWTISLYLTDRKFGGHEEGGWWYNVGERVDTTIMSGSYDASVPVVCRNENEAHAKARGMRERYLPELNRGRRPVSSMLSDGEYEFEVHRGYPPKSYPERRPHYE